jgi:nuclear GTP-binding protein
VAAPFRGLQFNLLPPSQSPLQARKRKLGGEDELAGMAADAAARDKAFGVDAAPADDGAIAVDSVTRAGEITRRQFYRHVKQLLEKADILLEVLDARDPLSCRAAAVEALALSMEPPKRIVLVLNKIDLVPPEVVQQWLAYLRKDFPTIAFKASTQQQRTHLAAPGGAAINSATERGEVLTGSGAAGTDTLMQLIKNYSRSHDLKTAVTVGVVGYPNVGKSSVINSLKRSKAVSVSSVPGHTRTLQEVSLDSKINLIDCPGVIFDDQGSSEGTDGETGLGGSAQSEERSASLLLRNCVRVEDIDDPEAAVDGILKRCAPERLMALYAIPAYTNTNEFLVHIAAKKGKLGKGGVADKAGAARSILQDWNTGKIPFYVLPPTSVSGGGSAAAGDASGSAMDEDDNSGAAKAGKAGKASKKAAAASSAGAGASTSVLVTKDEEDVDTAAIVSGWAKVSCLSLSRVIVSVSSCLSVSCVPTHTKAITLGLFWRLLRQRWIPLYALWCRSW